MNATGQWIIVASLAGAVTTSPALAQDAEEWDDDEPMIHEHIMNLDRELRSLGEELGGLDGALAFDFNSVFTPFFDHERDRELSRLEREAHDIARRARAAEGSEKTSLEQELDNKLNEIFDYKLERQEKSIERAEDRVEKLKDHRSKRESARDEIIRNRKNELLGREEYLEW